MTFTATATRLAGAAGLMFGWCPDTFWRATPAELGAMIDALRGEIGSPDPPDAQLIDRLKEQFPDG